MAWANAATPAVGDADNGGWANHTIRQLVSDSLLSHGGETHVRVTFYASSAEAFSIGKAYIGLAHDAASDWYDFGETPTQLLFDGGSADFDIAAGESKVSDMLEFSFDDTKDLLISFWVKNNAATDGLRRDTAITSWYYYYKAGGDDAATVNATGYTEASSSAIGVFKIESIVISGPAGVKSVNEILTANIKSVNEINLADIKALQGLT